MKTVERDIRTAIIRAGMGDIRAFESIVRRYHRLAFGYALSILKDDHLAEDVVQESFTDVYKHLRDLNSPDGFPAWLRRIVFKHCDRITRRKRYRETSYDDTIAGGYECPQSRVERMEQEESIRALVGKLPAKQRLVTELYYLDGLSQNDISRFLDIQPTTVRKRLFDSRKRLRKEMAMPNEQETETAVRELFKNRIAPDLLEKLLTNPAVINAAGEERNLTVLFADAVAITDQLRKMEIKEFFSFMNKHFEILFDIIVTNQGFIDKIIGDEFMAIWGTPANPKDHATLACYAAIEMQAKLRTMRESGEQGPGGEYRVSIGINTGNALIGNFGPPSYLQYTPLGDSINLGARLEGESRTYGVEIVIGEETYRNAKANIVARKLDDIDVRNRNEKVGIYELVGRKGVPLSESVKRKLTAFEKGYDAFSNNDIPKARKSFLAALEASGGMDVPSLIYLQRCAKND